MVSLAPSSVVGLLYWYVAKKHNNATKSGSVGPATEKNSADPLIKVMGNPREMGFDYGAYV